MATSEGDVYLIEAVQQGDQNAWREVIGRYEGRLLSFARRMLAQRSEAEDLVQETFLGLLRSLPNYDKRRSLERGLARGRPSPFCRDALPAPRSRINTQSGARCKKERRPAVRHSPLKDDAGKRQAERASRLQPI